MNITINIFILVENDKQNKDATSIEEKLNTAPLFMYMSLQTPYILVSIPKLLKYRTQDLFYTS